NHARAPLLKAGDHAQRGGLSAPGRAEQRHALPRLDVEANVAHCRNVSLHLMPKVRPDRFEADAVHHPPPTPHCAGSAAPAGRRRSNALTHAVTAMTITMTNTENAAAGPSDSSVMFSRMRTVIKVQPMDTRKIVALIAVIERMNTTPTPARKAGITSGSVTRRKVVPLRAPRLRDASSRLLSICCSSAIVVRIPAGL